MQYGRTHILNRDRNVEINLIEDVGDPIKDGEKTKVLERSRMDYVYAYKGKCTTSIPSVSR